MGVQLIPDCAVTSVNRIVVAAGMLVDCAIKPSPHSIAAESVTGIVETIMTTIMAANLSAPAVLLVLLSPSSLPMTDNDDEENGDDGNDDDDGDNG